MNTVFDLPVATVQCEQTCRIRLLSHEACDPKALLLGALTAANNIAIEVGRNTFDAEHLSYIREVQVVVQCSACPDASDLDPAVALINRLVLRGEKPLSSEACRRLGAVVVPLPSPQRRGRQCPCEVSVGCL